MVRAFDTLTFGRCGLEECWCGHCMHCLLKPWWAGSFAGCGLDLCLYAL